MRAELPAPKKEERAMKIKTNVKAGGIREVNHNQARVIRVKSGVKAGGIREVNHNQN
jgi:hypothetical protein